MNPTNPIISIRPDAATLAALDALLAFMREQGGLMSGASRNAIICFAIRRLANELITAEQKTSARHKPRGKE